LVDLTKPPPAVILGVLLVASTAKHILDESADTRGEAVKKTH
jgi:hypothetical protein